MSDWATNGAVNALAVSGKTLYVGGNFTQIGPRTGPVVAVSTATGTLDNDFPAASGGNVSTIIGDGAGGWFVGGSFAKVADVGCANLAHVLADSSVDRRFCPRPDGGIQALAVVGSRLYVGGGFHRIGGVARAGLAALSAASGATLPWDPRLTGHAYGETTSSIVAIAPAKDKLYIAGDFDRVGGKTRDGVAAVSAADARPTAWAPKVEWAHDGWGLVSLAATPTRVYGDCSCAVGDTFRNGLVALDAGTGALLPWNPGQQADALALSGRTLYVGGPFKSIAGAPRRVLRPSTRTPEPSRPGTRLPGAGACQLSPLQAPPSTQQPAL